MALLVPSASAIFEQFDHVRVTKCGDVFHPLYELAALELNFRVKVRLSGMMFFFCFVWPTRGLVARPRSVGMTASFLEMNERTNPDNMGGKIHSEKGTTETGNNQIRGLSRNNIR